MVAKISDQLHAVRRVVVVGAGGDYEQWLAGASPEEPAHQASPDDCLMQMYTSGTTGFPKGAMLTHRSMIAHVRAGVPAFGFDADSVALVAMPLFHVSGTTWALQCMAVGGQTIVLHDIVPADVLDQLAHDRISHAFFVPAIYQFFLSVPGVRGRDYSSLRCLGYGGSPMPLPLLRELWVPKTYATRRYSWITPPTRSRRRTRKWSRSVTLSGSGRSGAAWFRVRCGRCVL
jgi:acyl-CoA synthetase (AMP-forming)/AMP-acid ligase II